MPWITVEEPFAKPPRVAPPGRHPEWTGPLSLDRGLAELDDVAVSVGAEIDFGECLELEIRESTVDGLVIQPGQGPNQEMLVRIHRSHLEGCDLSGRTVQSVRGSRFTACKMIGTDFSGGTIDDTVFERCQLRYANLRMARLSRVSFVDCSFDDVDCYQMEAEHITFPGSQLSAVNLDGLKAEAFDLREAGEITLSGVTRLDGCLVAEHQLPGMAHSLAMAAGVQVERPPDDDE